MAAPLHVHFGMIVFALLLTLATDRVSARRDEALGELEKIVKDFEEGPEKAELYHRLGDLYFEKVRELEGTGKDASTVRTQALQTYDALIRGYPAHPRMDEVLFNKAAILYAAGKKQLASDIYFGLVERHPTSPLVPDALLALGDAAFAGNDLFRATIYFHKAADTKKPRIQAYATYRLAWCQYNAQDDRGALALFEKVVELADAQTKKDRVQLREEALKDMLLVFARLGQVEEAFQYYSSKLAHGDALAMLAKLGAVYGDAGEHARAVKAYRIAGDQMRVVEGYAALGRYDDMRLEAKRLLPNQPGVEQALRELTTSLHRDAQKTKVERMYAAARDLYEIYLAAFASRPEAYGMRYDYAELLFRQKQYDRAGAAFDEVAADPKGKFAKDAALAAAQAWELGSGGQRLVDACERFIARAPNDPLATKMRRATALRALEQLARQAEYATLEARAAAILRDATLVADQGFAANVRDLKDGAAFKRIEAGDEGEAPRRFLSFAEENPKSKYAEVALHDAMVRAEAASDAETALAAGERLLKQHPKAKSAEATAFLIAALHERVGDKAKALKAFRRYRQKFPKGARSEDADWNIAYLADALGKDRDAIAAYARYVDDHPKAKERARAYLRMGALYERSKDYKAMAQHYAGFDAKVREATGVQSFEALAKQQQAMRAWKGSADWQAVWTRYQRLLPAERDADSVLAAAAEARFELAHSTYQRFIGQRLTRRLADALAKKVKLLADVEREYGEVLKLKNGQYGIAALKRIGHAYEEMANALRSAPLPRGLSAEQREIYRAEIESRAFPIEEKALEAFGKAAEKAKEIGLDPTSKPLASN